MARKPTEFIGFPDELKTPFGPYRAIARFDIRYDDGDTLWFLIDKGFNDYTFKAIRLQGIDAPELKGIRASLDAAPARDHLFHLLPYNAQCLLFTQPDPEGRGRYVADVLTLHHGDLICANVEMVRAGHAVIKHEWGWLNTVETCIDMGIGVSDLITVEAINGSDSPQPG